MATKTEIKELVNKEMTIGEVISKYPESADIMTSYGLHCVGCGVNPYESIVDGCLGHGMNEETLDNMIKEINNGIKNKEDNKDKIIIVTEKAVKELKRLMKEEEKDNYGLKFTLDKTTMDYGLDFAEKQEKNELVISDNEINIFIDKNDLELVKGIEIDYVKNERGEGFKISNPNMKSGGCGSGCGCSH